MLFEDRIEKSPLEYQSNDKMDFTQVTALPVVALFYCLIKQNLSCNQASF